MPGLKTTTYGTGNYEWMYNTRGIRDGVTAVLDPAKFTQATHFPDGYIRSGTPVRVNDLTDITPWADAAGAKLGFIGGEERAAVRRNGPWARVSLSRGHVLVRSRVTTGLTGVRSTGRA